MLTNDSPLAILNVSHNYHVAGGSDQYFLELGKLLELNGHPVVPYCSASAENAPTPYAEYFPRSFDAARPGIGDAARFIYSREAKRNLNRLLDDNSVDLAHLHIYYGKLTASILKPLTKRGIPIVQTLHEYKLLCPVYTCMSGEAICEACAGNSFWHCAAKRCNRGSFARSLASTLESYVSGWLGAANSIDRFIGVSQFMTDKMREIGIPAEKLRTIHNFVDAKSFAPAQHAGNYILYFGRLERTKGIFTLFEAMRRLPGITCKLAGTGAAERDLHKFAEDHQIDNVEMLGFVSGSKLHELIRGSICTVIPSEWYENCPMSVLESLALGRPVIGSRIGGIPELIHHRVDGLLFEAGNADQLTEAIESMAKDPYSAHAMGAAGRNRVEKEFSADLHYEKIRQVYGDLLE